MRKIITVFLLLIYYIDGSAQTPSIATDNTDIRIFPSSNNQSEISISINKNDPSNILVGANTSPNAGLITLSSVKQGHYFTQNGGQTWSGADHMPNNQDGYSDPSTCFDVDGDAFISTLSHAPEQVLVQKSTNKGTTWGNSVTVSTTTQTKSDKEMIVAVDDNPNSPFVNHFYCVWNDVASHQLLLRKSTDKLATFLSPVVVSNNTCLGANVQIGPDGEVYVASVDHTLFPGSDGSIFFQYSSDGGQTFTEMPVTFQYSCLSNSIFPITEFGGIRMNHFPSLGVDKSCGEHRGRIYVAFMSGSYGDYSDINVMYSDNHGLSWSQSVNPISVQNGRFCFFPWIDVDVQTGLVTVIYYAMDNNDPQKLYETNTYVAYSTDGANSWQNIKVSDVPHNTSSILGTDAYCGDYIGISTFGGKAFAAWHDNRPINNTSNPGPWQVYISKIDFAGLSAQSSVSGNLIISNGTISGVKTFRAGNNLTTNNPNTTKIGTTADVAFLAGNSIILEPNFLTEPNSEFLAQIDNYSPCHVPGTPSFKKEEDVSEDEIYQENEDGTKLFAYPIPTDEYITIGLSSERELISGVLNIINNNGQVILSRSIKPFDKNSFREIINFSEFPSGIYQFTLFSESKNYSGKFIKL